MNYKHVIGHYWEERREHLAQIVQRLNQAGVQPIIWNNSPSPIPTEIGNCVVVQCPNNPIHGRYLAALIYPEAEYFLFQDDDLIFEQDSLDKLFAAVTKEPGYFYGVEGRGLNWKSPTPYSTSTTDRDGSDTYMVIRAYIGHRSILQHGLNWILTHGISPGRCETILFTGGRSRLVSDAVWEDFPLQDGVGLWYQQQHCHEIDAFANQWLKPS